MNKPIQNGNQICRWENVFIFVSMIFPACASRWWNYGGGGRTGGLFRAENGEANSFVRFEMEASRAEHRFAFNTHRNATAGILIKPPISLQAGDLGAIEGI